MQSQLLDLQNDEKSKHDMVRDIKMAMRDMGMDGATSVTTFAAAIVAAIATMAF